MKTRRRTKPTTKQKLTKSALADALGISRQALNVHLKLPDAPPIDRIDLWQVLLAERGRIGTAPEDLRRSIAKKRLEILGETEIKLARENQIEAGKYVLACDAIRQAGEAGGYFMSQLERWARELPPVLAGLSAPEVAQILDVNIERTRAELQKKLNTIGD